MRALLCTLVTVSLIGCATPKPDPIARLVTRVSSDPMWRWGLYPRIDLPRDGTTGQVVAEVFKTTAFNTASRIRTAKTFKVLETRQVHIPANGPDAYTAALVKTDLGVKIALFQWDNTLPGWWSGVYDAHPPAATDPPAADAAPSSLPSSQTSPLLVTTFGTHATADGAWRILVSDHSLEFSHSGFSSGKGTMTSGWVTTRPQGWTTRPGWFVYVENGSRAWAYDGDRQLLLDSETAEGDTFGGTLYCQPDFPCSVPEAVVSRLPPPAVDSKSRPATPPFTPAITLERALSLVKAYVLETNLDTSGYYLKSIDLKLDKDGTSGHWEAQWVPSSAEARDDGFIIRVDMDRTVSRIPPEK